MNADTRASRPERDALVGVARVARVLVALGGLSDLAEDAMTEIREALELDFVASFLADTSGSRVLHCLGKSAAPGSPVHVTQTLSLDPEAWRFINTSGRPLVFRKRTGWVIENPFQPAVDHWVVLPLVSDLRILGALVGCSPEPISLAPAAVARFSVIGDLLSAGAANAMLRAEIQRSELQRERMRLAEEIHDSLAQDLAVAVRELALLDTNPAQEITRASEERLRQAVLEAHHVVRRHLEVLAGDNAVPGLRAGVQDVCARFRRRGMAVTMAAPVPDQRVDSALVVVVMRVLSEALANVQRHAGVTEATVSLSSDGETLQMSIVDRGHGFEVHEAVERASGHFGVAIMHERARASDGTLRINSRRGHGTRVELSLPIKRSDA